MDAPKTDPPERLAQLVEKAQAGFYRSRAELADRVHPDFRITILPLKGGGVAVSSAEITDYQFNFAFVTEESVDDENLHAIEELYRSNNRPARVIIPSWTPQCTLDRLTTRGYTAQRPFNVYVLPLDEAEVFNKGVVADDGLFISAASTPNDFEEFIRFHASTTGPEEQPTETDELFARLVVMTPRSRIYLARINGRIIGANAVTYLEPEPGELMAYFQLGSTLPEYRRRGISTALNYAAQVGAKQKGCRYWYCQAYPDSASASIMERLGCRVSFEFLFYVKEHSPAADTPLFSTPWVAALLRDKAYTTLPPRARYELNGVWDDLFFENTMKTPATIPERIYQIKGPRPADELRAFFRIGTDVTGAPATLMGGVAAAIMDQCFGLLMVYHGQHCEVKVIPEKNMLDAPVTTQMSMNYVRRVVVPAVVVVYVRLSEALGKNRWRIVGEMQDSEGRVCVKSECYYVRVQARI